LENKLEGTISIIGEFTETKPGFKFTFEKQGDVT